MDKMRLLIEFFEATRDDARISPAHVSIYAAIYYFWLIGGCKNPFPVQRDNIMQLSKIFTRYTFYRTIKDLQEFGFIKYIPSMNQFLESLVYLLDQDESILKSKSELDKQSNKS